MALFAGIIIGFLLALPPGGIVLFGLNLSMRIGFRRALPYAYGTMLVDMGYALIAVLGAQAAIDSYTHVAEAYPLLIVGVQGLLIAALFGYGGYLFFRHSPLIHTSRDGALVTGATRSRHSSRRGPFLVGIGLNLSNIFSPTFLAALAILASQAQAFGILSGDREEGVLYAIGFGIGNTVYMQTGMYLVEKYTGSLQQRHLIRIQKIAGCAFACIGALLLLHAVQP